LGLQGGDNASTGTAETVLSRTLLKSRALNVNNDYLSLDVVWADFDNDRDLDLYMANDSTPNLLLSTRETEHLMNQGISAAWHRGGQ